MKRFLSLSNNYLLIKIVCFQFLFLIMSTTIVNAKALPISNDSISKRQITEIVSPQTVCTPIYTGANTKIMNWAINITQNSVDGTHFAFYTLYLNSLTNKYGLFIPTDEYFIKYIDPIAYGQDVQGVLKFWYNVATSAVNATVYRYDKTTNLVGDSVAVITNSSFITNRILNFLNNHIVVGDVQSGNQYYITKSNDIIKVNGTGSLMTVQGGGDIIDNTQSNVTTTFSQINGSTYFLDKPIQPALKSVYKTLRRYATVQ